jgi:hypothetical protein
MRWVVPLIGILSGCAVATGNTITPHDGGQDARERSDAGIVQGDAGDDADTIDAAADDAAEPVDGGSDAAASDAGADAGPDAGHDAATPTPPTIDGVVGSTEWAGAASATNAVATSWTGNQLTALRAVAIGGTLYLAIEGQVQANNGMVVYLDGDPGGSHGIADLTTLTDSTPSYPGLDDVVSAGFTQPATFRADLAWGTTVMSHLASASDPLTGFRDITTNVNDFGWLSGTQTACTAAACEASVVLSALGPAASPRTIAIFARIAGPNGLQSPNQTLPPDDASNPRVVSVVMTIHE